MWDRSLHVANKFKVLAFDYDEIENICIWASSVEKSESELGNVPMRRKGADEDEQ